jgi:hypothetical protein
MPSFTEKVRQVFHVDVEASRFIRFEAAVLGTGALFLEIAQVAHAELTQLTVQS